MLASGGDDTRILIWNLWDSDLMYGDEPCPRAISSYAGHLVPSFLAAFTFSHSLCPQNNIFSIVFSPDGRTVYASGLDCLITAHDIEASAADKSPKDLWRAHEESIHRISVNSAGLLLSAGTDGFVTLWDTRQANKEVGGLSMEVEQSAVAFCPSDDNLFVCGGGHGSLEYVPFRLVYSDLTLL